MNFNTLRAELKNIETYICISFHLSTLKMAQIIESHPGGRQEFLYRSCLSCMVNTMSADAMLLPYLLSSPGISQPRRPRG